MTVTIEEILNGRFEGDTAKGHTEGARSAFEKCNNNFDGLKVAVDALQVAPPSHTHVEADITDLQTYTLPDGSVLPTANWDFNGYGINSLGDVGIGIASPARELHVYKATGNAAIRIEAAAADSIASIQVKNDALLWVMRVNGTFGDQWELLDSTNTKRPLIVQANADDELFTLTAIGTAEVRGLGLLTDNIGEVTSGVGVTVDGVELKDGLVDGRDVSADGAAQDSHIANTSNPHSVTAAQVGAPTIAQLDDNRKLSLMGF